MMTSWNVYLPGLMGYDEETHLLTKPEALYDLLKELYETYGEQLIVDFAEKEIWIYDGYME